MKKPLLLSLTALAVLGVTTATTLYAQTTTGSSVIARMKAAAAAFTLSADLNPGQTGFESAPVSWKKTGNMLTAAEWNRMLELISEGGSGGGSGWENVPLTDTADYDTNCLYRFDVDFIVDDANRKYMNATSAKAYMIGISNKFLQRFLDAGNSWMWGIPSTNKSQYGYRNSSGVFTVTNNVQITKMEKLCGGSVSGGGDTFVFLDTPILIINSGQTTADKSARNLDLSSITGVVIPSNAKAVQLFTHCANYVNENLGTVLKIAKDTTLLTSSNACQANGFGSANDVDNNSIIVPLASDRKSIAYQYEVPHVWLGWQISVRLTGFITE